MLKPKPLLLASSSMKLVERLMHKDITEFIEFMISKLAWYGDEKFWPKTLIGRLKLYYSKAKIFVYVVGLIALINGLALQDDFGILSGTFAYVPVHLMMVVLTGIAFSRGEQQQILTASFNENFLEHSEPWMRAIKNKYVVKCWKFVRFMELYNMCIMFLYGVCPVLISTILHFALGFVDHPFHLPGPFTAYLNDVETYRVQFFTVQILNYLNLLEMADTLLFFIASYTLLSSFFLSEVVIFKEQLRRLRLLCYESQEEVDKQFKEVISSHNVIIKLNVELKDYLGLSCAFIIFITSLVLTLTVFTVYTSSNIPVVMAYGSGFVLYFSCGLLYCRLGQQIENESEEIFWTLYELQWYRNSPFVRKNLNMMIRQARKPLTIDYHGRSRMNLSSFMQILRSSYSYFTLLQSMVTK